MNLKVGKVFINDALEGEDVIRTRYLFFQDIDSIEEGVHNKEYTAVYLKSGEVLTVNENINSLYERIETIKEEEKRNEIIG